MNQLHRLAADLLTWADAANGETKATSRWPELHAALDAARVPTADQPFHFYASSQAQWFTTTPDRDLRALLKRMDKDGNQYNLFYVPLPHDASYKIEHYAPVVNGRVFMGRFGD